MRKHTAATVGDDMYTEVILSVRRIGDLARGGLGRRGHRPGQEQVRRGDQRAAAVPTLHRLHRRQNKTDRRHARLMPNSYRHIRRNKTVLSVSCLVSRYKLDDCFERVQTSNFPSATVSSCRESNSHRQSRRDTDKTVLSCLAWRCELALRIFAS